MAFILICLSVSAQNRSIKFEQCSWKEIKSKASKENKLIFIDCYTSWCVPCKWLAKKVFTNDTIADYFNAQFICAKMDMEIGEGKELAKKYDIHVYPTLIICDANGEVVNRSCGAGDVNRLLTFAKDAQIPGKSYSSLTSTFVKGNYSTEFIANYLKTTKDICLNTDDILKTHFATQKENDLSNAQNWTLIRDYLVDAESPTFKYMLANKDDFSKMYSEDSVQKKISSMYLSTCMNIIKDPQTGKDRYNTLKNELKRSNLKNVDKLLGQTDLSYYNHEKDWINYAKTAVPLIDTYFFADAKMLNDVCWVFYEKIDDKNMLNKALAWSKTGNELERENPFNMDTYACLLYKVGQKEEAIKVEKRAIEIAKSQPDKYNADFIVGMETQIGVWKR